MSLEDLKEAGLLLPEEEWGEHQLTSTVNRPALIGVGVLALGSCILMLVGGGGGLTWVGGGGFLLALGGFLWVGILAVEAQNAAMERK